MSPGTSLLLAFLVAAWGVGGEAKEGGRDCVVSTEYLSTLRLPLSNDS